MEGIRRYLEGIEFPATKQELIAAADDNDAPQEVIEALQQVDGEQFSDLDDLEQSL